MTTLSSHETSAFDVMFASTKSTLLWVPHTGMSSTDLLQTPNCLVLRDTPAGHICCHAYRWRSGQNTDTLPAILLTVPPSKTADTALVCVLRNQALWVCRRFVLLERGSSQSKHSIERRRRIGRVRRIAGNMLFGPLVYGTIEIRCLWQFFADDQHALMQKIKGLLMPCQLMKGVMV